MLPDVEREIKELADQIKDGKKVVEVEGRSILIKFPNSDDELNAKREYSRVLGELLKDGNYQTESEMKEIMKKRKIWTEKDDDKLKSLATQKNEHLNQYIIAETEEDKLRSLKEHNKISEELDELQNKQTALMSNTIESIAKEVKYSHLIYRCAYDFDTDKPLWNNYKEYAHETDRGLKTRVTYEFLLFYQGIPQVFLGQLPEEMEESVQTGESDGK